MEVEDVMNEHREIMTGFQWSNVNPIRAEPTGGLSITIMVKDQTWGRMAG